MPLFEIDIPNLCKTSFKLAQTHSCNCICLRGPLFSGLCTYTYACTLYIHTHTSTIPKLFLASGLIKTSKKKQGNSFKTFLVWKGEHFPVTQKKD